MMTTSIASHTPASRSGSVSMSSAFPCSPPQLSNHSSPMSLRYRHDPYSRQGCVIVNKTPSAHSTSFRSETSSEFVASSTPPLDTHCSGRHSPSHPSPPLAYSAHNGAGYLLGAHGTLSPSNAKATTIPAKTASTTDASTRDMNTAHAPTQAPNMDDANVERVMLDHLPEASTADFRMSSGGEWVELCFGQLPFGLSAVHLRSFLAHCVPEAEIVRCAFQKKPKCAQSAFHGLRFVSLRNNGAAEKMISMLHKAVSFDVGGVALWARDEAAKGELQRLSAWRRENMKVIQQKVPFGPLTVEWSNHRQNIRRGVKSA